MSNLFEKVPGLGVESVPVLDVIHSEWHDGVKYRVTQTISRLIYSDFDRLMSDYAAATEGEGLPAYKVVATVVKLTDKEAPARSAPSYHETSPHALLAAVERAHSRVGDVELLLQRADCAAGKSAPKGLPRKIDATFVELMRRGLAIAEQMGTPAFLDMTGEFEVVSITPPGGLDPVLLDLAKGIVRVPSVKLGATDILEWPILSFAERVASNMAVQNYLAAVRHAVVVEKDAAIRAFRAKAEDRVRNFAQALGDRPLNGHWRERAEEMVARLRDTHGQTMAGLSDDARGIALDWCAELDAQPEMRAA